MLQNFIMQLQEFRSSLARGGLLPENRGLSPITPASALSEWRSPFSARSTETGPLSAALSVGSASLNRPIPDAESLPALSPGPSSAPSGLPWPNDQSTPSQRSRALSSVRTSPTYIDPAGHIIPSVNIVEPERQEINTKIFTLPAFPYKADDSATPTEALTSPRSTEFAMAPLNPSAEVDSADSFGLMSPTSTEFASSPFDRSALLAQLGMGSMQHHDQVPLRTRSNNPQSKPRSLATPSGKMLRGKVSSPSIREQQELQRLQADIEKKLHIEQQQNHQHQHHHQPLLPKPAGAPQTKMEGFGDALMSPRATEFTENPFAIALAPPTATTIPEEQKPTALDPRSPAHKGVSPITRNIGDVL
jgi:tyrosine-protein phosphatase